MCDGNGLEVYNAVVDGTRPSRLEQVPNSQGKESLEFTFAGVYPSLWPWTTSKRLPNDLLLSYDDCLASVDYVRTTSS